MRATSNDFPANREKIVIHSIQTSRFEPTDAMPEMTLARSDQPSAVANLVALEQGLYALEIGANPGMLGQVSSLQVPAVHVSALRNERERSAEIIGTSGRGDGWLDREGGTVIVKSPAGGAHVLLTVYGLPAQAVSVPDIQVRRLDRPRSNGAAPRSPDPADYPADVQADSDLLAGRSMLVRRAEPLPIECVARGYLSGSGWKDYRATGEVCGIRLPAGLRESDKLTEPIFTPATKAQSGHDLNISEAQAAELVHPRILARVRDLTLKLYAEGFEHAERCGIIVADTKFEFGVMPGVGPEEDRVILIDEVLTPDSSRFWPRDGYRPGGAQPSFDKQFVRDYLEAIRWNKQPPVPSLPDDVVARTREKYVEAFHRLTGRELE